MREWVLAFRSSITEETIDGNLMEILGTEDVLDEESLVVKNVEDGEMKHLVGMKLVRANGKEFSTMDELRSLLARRSFTFTSVRAIFPFRV